MAGPAVGPRVVAVERGPSGAVIFSAGGARFFWAGPGSAPRLMFGDALVSVDAFRHWHPADEAEARVMVKEFFR